MKTRRFYIAYGSNLNIAQMAFRCPDAKPVGTSTLNNYRLVFQGQPHNAHANVIPAKGYQVPVAIWEISPQDEKMLDRYEGVKGGYYYKDYMPVSIEGKTYDALIYIMTPHNYGIPSDYYLSTIVTGYKDFNLDIRPLNDAVLESRHSYLDIAANI